MKRMAAGRPGPRDQGFTLIEVLVALGITAISLMAGLQASSAITRLAERQHTQWLAELCAQNALVQVRLSPTMPALGRGNLACAQLGQNFLVTVQVDSTPNPSFRKVQASVGSEGHTWLQVSTVVGRF
jgi:general secretion pathway protein I